MAAYSTLTDIELSNLLRSGDHFAYTEIFNRYNSLLYIHAYRKLHKREEAKDIVQEVFAMLWTRREEFEFKSNLVGFLYTCVHRKILDLFSHQKTVTKYLDFLQLYLKEGKSSADHLIRTKQLSIIIEKEIAALPPKMREVFELSRKKQLSYKEIAVELDISEETVKGHVKNALRILRVRLGLFIFLFFFIRF
jgi:RNA polymerase sigma-70 factor (ECF subfamily)